MLDTQLCFWYLSLIGNQVLLLLSLLFERGAFVQFNSVKLSA